VFRVEHPSAFDALKRRFDYGAGGAVPSSLWAAPALAGPVDESAPGGNWADRSAGLMVAALLESASLQSEFAAATTSAALRGFAPWTW
jgi:hypothetical protein